MDLPSNFQDLLKNCSLDEKKSMLEVLIRDIQDTETAHAANGNLVNPTAAFDQLVSQNKTFFEDESFLSSLGEELDSLNLYSPQSMKPKSMCFSLKGGNYYHNGKKPCK